MGSGSRTDAGPVDVGAAARTPLPASVAERTVPALLARCVADAPDRLALVAESATAGEQRLTYRDLATAAGHVAGGLRDAGIHPGDRIALLISNDAAAEGHVAVHGAHRVGAIVVPINVRLAAREIAWCIDNAGCRCLIYEPGLREKVEDIASAIPSLSLVTLGARTRPDELTWTDLVEHASADQVPVEPGDGATWVFTSGTTGYPKIVAHTHETCVACGIQVADAWDLHPGDIHLNSHPFFTASGTNTDLMSALWATATNVVEPRFSPETTVARAQREGATTASWMTPMLNLMFAADVFDGARFDSLRRVCYGGQMMPTEFHLKVDDVLVQGRGLELIHMIGQSEAGPGGIILDPALHRERLGSVGNRGFSAELTEYALIDPETGRHVGPGEEGDLCYRCPSIMQGYVGAPDETAEVIRDGWLHSGDLCRYDEDGFVYFVDRMKDVIRRGGINIASAEIERVVRESPDVADVAAVPAPHEVLGEVVKVVVVRRPGSELDADGVIAFAAARLADFKVPRVVAFADELPRNDMGKVQKARLRG